MWASPPLHDPAALDAVVRDSRAYLQTRPSPYVLTPKDPLWASPPADLVKLLDAGPYDKCGLRQVREQRNPATDAARTDAMRQAAVYERVWERNKVYTYKDAAAFIQLRTAIRGVTVLALLDVLDGRRTEGVQRLLLALSPGLKVLGNGPLFPELVGMALTMIPLEALLEVLQTPIPELSSVQATLEGYLSDLPPVDRATDNELVWAMDTLHAAQNDPVAYQTMHPELPYALRSLALRRIRRETANRYLDVRQAVKAGHASSVPTQPGDSTDVGMVLAIHNSLRARLGAAVLLCALHEWHRIHGTWPARLEDLTPGLIRNLPSNSMAHDGRYVYRREGSTFVLEGPGEDFSRLGQTPAVYYPLSL